MKIAILTSGILPIPAVQGGAVEQLIDVYLDYNERHRMHDITVYSVADEAARRHPATQSAVNHYHYIDMRSLAARIKKRIHQLVHDRQYYHYSIEYFFAAALRHIGQHDFDLVIVENRPGYIPRIASRTQARIVLHLHNDFLNDATPYGRDIADACFRIVSISHYITNRVQTIGINQEKCVTVYNGLNLQLFSPEHTKAARRAHFGLSPDDFVLLFSGRIIPEKGIAQLIEAMTLLADYPQVKLLVMGSPFYAAESSDSLFMQTLKERAARLTDRLLFTGYIPYPQMPQMLLLGDAAVVPSVWDEPFGMTAVEALAMGLPVIATDRGGLTECLSPDCSLIVPADAELPQHLKEAILDLYTNADKCRQMGQAARLRANSFSQDAYANHFFTALSIKN